NALDQLIERFEHSSTFANVGGFCNLGESEMIGMGDLFEYYYQHFAVVRANTPRLLDQVYRLRYQVYCIENQFEDPNEHLDGREMDEHDAASAHILLLHRKSGTAVGTARLI